ncbi:hypothetical protein MICRO11B_40071 [Micrococcus luteus]|nr:hypothetical protein MICRO11B_40071 [Micrococcus luteus]
MSRVPPSDTRDNSTRIARAALSRRRVPGVGSAHEHRRRPARGRGHRPHGHVSRPRGPRGLPAAPLGPFRHPVPPVRG